MTNSNDQIRQNVRNRYKKIALQAVSVPSRGCSSEGGCCTLRLIAIMCPNSSVILLRI